MTTNGLHPYVAAHLARYRADELAYEARAARRRRLARRSRRNDRDDQNT